MSPTTAAPTLDPLDAYLHRLNLSPAELEALLVAIDDRLDVATTQTRMLLEPCRDAVLRELGAMIP